jgi:hypothetical protein
MSSFNNEKYHASIQKLDVIFRDMSDSINSVSKWRCPYKNVTNQCTAKFRCRNQDRTLSETTLYACKGSDSINYESAWEVGTDS